MKDKLITLANLERAVAYINAALEEMQLQGNLSLPSMAGNAGKVLAVNSNGDGVEWAEKSEKIIINANAYLWNTASNTTIENPAGIAIIRDYSFEEFVENINNIEIQLTGFLGNSAPVNIFSEDEDEIIYQLNNIEELAENIGYSEDISVNLRLNQHIYDPNDMSIFSHCIVYTYSFGAIVTVWRQIPDVNGIAGVVMIQESSSQNQTSDPDFYVSLIFQSESELIRYYYSYTNADEMVRVLYEDKKIVYIQYDGFNCQITNYREVNNEINRFYVYAFGVDKYGNGLIFTGHGNSWSAKRIDDMADIVESIQLERQLALPIEMEHDSETRNIFFGYGRHYLVRELKKDIPDLHIRYESSICSTDNYALFINTTDTDKTITIIKASNRNGRVNTIVGPTEFTVKANSAIEMSVVFNVCEYDQDRDDSSVGALAIITVGDDLPINQSL